MSDSEELPVSIKISRVELDKAITVVVQAERAIILGEFKKELQDALATKDTELRERFEAFITKTDQLDDRVRTRIEAVDGSLDKLQKKVQDRVNFYVIPAAVFTILSLALAVFFAVGGFGALTGVQSLKDRLKSATSEFGSMEKDLNDVRDAIAKEKASLNGDRFTTLEDSVRKLTDRFNALVDSQATKKK